MERQRSVAITFDFKVISMRFLSAKGQGGEGAEKAVIPGERQDRNIPRQELGRGGGRGRENHKDIKNCSGGAKNSNSQETSVKDDGPSTPATEQRQTNGQRQIDILKQLIRTERN